MAAKKDKEAVEVEAVEEEEPTEEHTTYAPYGMQDMNVAVEPYDVSDGIDAPITRTLTDEVHVDMGRGALTFKPGDIITIRDGHIRNVTTGEGMEYSFKPAHEVAKEGFEARQKAAGEHLAAGQALDDQDAPSQPPDVYEEPEPLAEPEPAAAKEEDDDEQPRTEGGKFAKKED